MPPYNAVSKLERLFDEKAVLKREDIERELGVRRVKQLIKKSDLVIISDDNVTLPAIIDHEKKLEAYIQTLVASEEDGLWPFPATLDAELIKKSSEAFLARSRPSDKPKKRATIHASIMTCESRLVVLSGSPGTAKSTAGLELLKAYRQSRGDNKRENHDAFWVLAKNPFAMEKWCTRAGVQGATIDQVLTTREMGVGMIPKGAFVIIDEAGLIGTHDMMRLLERAVEDRWQKLVLLGDVKQDMPQSYGQPLAFILRCYPDISFQLTTPFRQRKTEERNFVNHLYNRMSQEALEFLQKNNRLHFAKDLPDIIQKTAAFFSHWRFGDKRNHARQCFCLAPDRDTVEMINRAVIKYQTDKGFVTDAYPTISPTGKYWSFGKGDRVILQSASFSKKHNNMAIKRGHFGTVVDSSPDGLTVAFDQKYGDKPAYRFKRSEPCLGPGYALTYDEAQGIAADCVAVVIAQKILGPQMMAACSRHRYECHVFASRKVYRGMKELSEDVRQYPVKDMPYLDTLPAGN